MNLLPDPLPGQFSLAVLPHGSTRQVLQVVARLALRGSLRVLDGGNRFNAYTVALALRQHTIEAGAVLEQIHVARAFTCYQVVTLLTQTPAIPRPTLVLDMLATDRIPFTSYHMPFPAVGYIDKRADGSYHYVPVSFQLDA